MAEPQSEFLTHSGRQTRLIEGLVYTVLNNGGSDAHVHRLLADPRLFTPLARQLVGPIWTLVDRSLPADADWDSSQIELIGDFDIGALLGSFCKSLEEVCYSEPHRPQAPTSYTLRHYEKPVAPEQVIAEHDVAGLRELLGYATAYLLGPEVAVEGVDIVALGSQRSVGGFVEYPSVTWFDDTPRRKRVQHLLDVRLGGIRMNPLPASCFFLVRVPQEQ